MSGGGQAPYAGGQMVSPSPYTAGSAYNNFASPNNFMSYPQQGQPNQPPALTAVPPPVQANQSPDMTGNAPGENMGFDKSGSDAGVGGQSVTQMQTPLQGGNPPSLSQYRPQQGLQIQGNPTSMPVQRRGM